MLATGELGRDRQLRILVFDVDRELELLRRVVRIELERSFRRAQRTLEVAKVRQREAQVVVRLGVVGASMDRAPERIARILELLELREHEPDAVPRHRLFRLGREHLAVRFESELHALPSEEQQREVEPGLHEGRLRRQRGAEGIDRGFRLAGVILRDAQVVVRDGVRRIEGERATIAFRGRRMLPLLMQRDAALAPDLGRVLLRENDLVIELDGGRRILLQEMHLGHCLPHEIFILVSLEREIVLLERFGVIALLAEGETEVVVREMAVGGQLERGRAALLARGHELVVPRRVVAIEGEVRLCARERRIELNGALGGSTRLFVATDVAEHEADEIERIRILGRELDRAVQRGERLIVEPAVVQHLANVLVHQRALVVERERALEPALCLFEIAVRLLGEPQLHDRSHVVGCVLQDRANSITASFASPIAAYARPSSQRASRSSGCARSRSLSSATRRS